MQDSSYAEYCIEMSAPVPEDVEIRILKAKRILDQYFNDKNRTEEYSYTWKRNPSK